MMYYATQYRDGRTVYRKHPRCKTAAELKRWVKSTPNAKIVAAWSEEQAPARVVEAAR